MLNAADGFGRVRMVRDENLVIVGTPDALYREDVVMAVGPPYGDFPIPKPRGILGWASTWHTIATDWSL